MTEDTKAVALDHVKYLQRIGIKDAKLEPNLSNLHLIQRQQVQQVPFENLSLHRGPNKTVTLDLPTLFDKIVTKKLGGFCFELNGLLAWLLGKVGYNQRIIPACVNRAHWEERMGEWSVYTHIFVMIRLNKDGKTPTDSKEETQDWLVDVGFGAHPQGPLRLVENEEQTLDEDGHKYRFIREGPDWISQRWCIPKGAWTNRIKWQADHETTRTGINFPADSADGLARVLDKASPFRSGVLVALHSRRKLTTLTGLRLIETQHPFGPRTVTLLKEEQIRPLLRERFGIVLDEEEDGGSKLLIVEKGMLPPSLHEPSEGVKASNTSSSAAPASASTASK